ncbi:MAG: TVP38/TMEM64 family protein [Alphaproteobacteria bacterium]
MERGGLLGGLIASTLFVAILLALLVLFDAHERVLLLLAWLDDQGPMALVMFMLVMALVVVLVLPGALFTTGAGVIFGVVDGTIGVVVGTTIGATLAFLIARYLFGARATKFVMGHDRLRSFSDSLTPRGWQIVLLMRLLPFFPSKLLNYFLGLTHVSLRGFVGGTFVGIAPFSLHNVYLGSIAGDIARLKASGAERTPAEWMLYGAGFLLIVGAVIFLGCLARRALAKYEESEVPECRG